MLIKNEAWWGGRFVTDGADRGDALQEDVVFDTL